MSCPCFVTGQLWGHCPFSDEKTFVANSFKCGKQHPSPHHWVLLILSVFLIQNFKCVLIYGIILYILFGFHRDFTFKNQISMWIYFPHLCIFSNVTFISLYNCMIWAPFIFSVMFHLSPWCFSWQYYTHLFNWIL